MANNICVGLQSKDDFVILNTTDPANISIAGIVDGYYGPSHNLDVSRVFGYCGTWAIIETLDFSNPANPTSPGLLSLTPFFYSGYDISLKDVIYHENNYLFAIGSVYQDDPLDLAIVRVVWKIDVSDNSNPTPVTFQYELGQYLDGIRVGLFSEYLHAWVSNRVYVISDVVNVVDKPGGGYIKVYDYYIASYSTSTCSPLSGYNIQRATPFPNPVWLIGSGNYLFGSLKGENRIWTIDISGNPNPINYLSITDPYGMDIQGNYLYVACPFYNRIYVVDISSPTSLAIVSQLTDATYLNNASNIKIDPHRNVAYVTCPAANRVTAIDISNPLSLSILGSIQDNVNLIDVFTVDTDITQVINPTLDVYVQAAHAKTFTINALIKTTGTKTFTIDAEIVTSGTKTFTLDAISQKINTKTFTFDTILETPVATVATYCYTGVAPGSGASATNLRFKLADNNTQDTNNLCIIPAAGTNRSYWKVIALYAVSPPATAINNVKLYTDGALPWTGCTAYVGNETPSTYSQATGGATSGDEIVANYGGGGVITAKTNLFTYTSGSSKSVSGSIGAASGKITNYVVLQVDISTTATEGVKAIETLTWQYDET